LVSAAAGSGKTTVLAERCAHLICDADEKCDVDDLLVVTFTEAAAAEMRDRIHKSLAQRHARQPSDHTGRQLAMIDRASVGTLHAFCARLLRQHFHLLGLDPDFLILDADEAELMQLEVARNMFADYYDMEGGGSDAFCKLVDCYADGTDERLVEKVIQAHDTLCSVVDPTAWLNNARKRIAQAIDLPLHESDLGRAYIKTIRQYLEAMRTQCADAGKAIKALKNFPFYVDQMRDLYRTIDHWLKVLSQHGLEMFVTEAATVELPPLPRVSNSVEGKEAAKGRVDDIRKAMKEGHWRQCLAFSPEEWKEGLERIQPHADTFLSLVEDFGARYAKAKDEEGGLDFSDLERFTLKALRDASEPDVLAPSPVAKMYHRQFKHVLVDEYQDINEVQDAILTLISRECVASDRRRVVPNLFCVGDVKQSIYRFRLAEPARFLKRRDVYSEKDSHGTVIDLQSNFRSRAPLLAVINAVFEKLMTADAADLNYDESQRLSPGAEFPASGDGAGHFSGAPIELHVLPKDAGTSSGGDEESDDAALDRSEREATLLAHRILEMTGKGPGLRSTSDTDVDSTPMHVFDSVAKSYRPIRYGDIVILLRSMRYKADRFAQKLRDAGIPVHSESATGYFEATEVNDVLSLLKVLDNQRQDIPLAAVLRSPFARIPEAEDQLARIRLRYPGDPPVPFHDAVAQYAAEQDDELAARLRDLLAQLAHWRRLARQRPLAELLWTIYTDTGYLAFCAGLPNGEQRQANLIELHERARQFGSFRRQGLSRFLQFLDKLKSESDLGQASIASEAEDVVRIMSIHRSKGLEFPVVMLPDLGKAFNLQDCQGSILLDRQAGLGLQVVDEERRIRYPSMASTVVQQRLRQQSLAEELRVLYVAMTRAKEHLIMVGTCSEGACDKWTTQWANHEGPLPAEAVLGARAMLDWIGPVSAVLARASTQTFELHAHTLEEVYAWSAAQQTSSGLTPAQAALAALRPLDPPPAESAAAREVIDRVSAPYAFTAFTKLRAAQSVTGQLLAATPASPGPKEPTQASQLQTLDSVLPKPAFLVGDLPPDAVDRGSATHAVLERLDFADAADAGAIARQIDGMVAARRLLAEHAKLVDVASILWLLQQDIGRMLRENAPRLLREVPVYLAADSAGAKDPLDRAMIRGRIDVLVPVGDGYTLVDYKTDRVGGDALADRAKSYAAQLALYRDAIERITGKRVTRTVIVFLQARETLDV
ncbi:MAG TPA: helicase-exonuclease AddAB subunit AddA, partial [Tepidisphaeraceae bacterium]|nr:helicase-exonuclease AddAB subunit AddA [Tepidisphaeraceae bacterium]